jgi:hypothetical protein
VCGEEESGLVPVKSSPELGAQEFLAPADALRPVIRRQSEICYLTDHESLPGRVLDLRAWVLPEDAAAVNDARDAYRASGQAMPKTMPDGLAAFVSRAGTHRIAASGALIPELTAVRTNIRAPASGVVPRFWYMLPDFAPRHLPAAFVARVIYRAAHAQCNAIPPLLIDANFSTFWSLDADWTPAALKALLSSVWCRTFMEVLGTPLGGGALKLEATHLRQMLVPRMSAEDKRALGAAGKRLSPDAVGMQAQIDAVVLGSVVSGAATDKLLPSLARDLEHRAAIMRGARQRAAS